MCEEIVKGKYICTECVGKLRFVKEPLCMICGKEIAGADQELCLDCTKQKRSFAFGRALLLYDAVAEHAMVRIKYQNKREYVDGFAKLLVYRYRNLIMGMHADCLVPVPIHKNRRKKRGYNQAELIANVISKETGIPVDHSILTRIKNTKAQNALMPGERAGNVKSAFLAKDIPAHYKTVILVDDIFTTGSTMEECTKALQREKEVKVYCLCLCIGAGMG